MESWARRHRGWLWGSVGALVVLVAVGVSVRAPVEDWWLAREACGGELPGDDLKTVRADVRLGSEKESFDEELGAYHCVLTSDLGKVVVAVDTYPAGSDRDQELAFAARSYAPHAVLPGGLPGFEDEHSRVLLMPECPSGGKGSSGKPRRLLVGTWAYFAESREEKAAMLRLAVRMTNVVTGKLGCGGQPLPAPEDGAVPDTGTYLPRAAAKGTACDALATTRVPAEGRDGKVRIAVADGGIVGRCTLRAPGEGGDGTKPGRPLVELTSWRGDWGTASRETGSGTDPLSGAGSAREPVLTDSLAWAAATCGGEDVGFAAHWGEDYSYRKAGKPSDSPTGPPSGTPSGPPSGPPTAAERDERRALLGEYVTAFAKDQVRRGACTGLRLPAHP
ncbi:hypothetical protein [Streptomyces sp. NPDC046631]|uniref:hypothetical protein n=1 Tax=unclassified Streptomyces TaxID=2593676 RepID=UPI0033F6E704